LAQDSRGPEVTQLDTLTAIERREARSNDEIPTRYDDLGALVWSLKAIPWQIPNSSGERSAR
jgi:hypothetical protein